MTVTVLTETETRFRTDPSTARSKPSVTATLANGRARLSAGPFNWDADLPVALGGENLAPSPTAYLLGALAGCGVAFLHDTLAPQFDVTIDDVSAVARCSADARGLLGLDGVRPTSLTSSSTFASSRRRRMNASRPCSRRGGSDVRSTSRCSSRRSIAARRPRGPSRQRDDGPIGDGVSSTRPRRRAARAGSASRRVRGGADRTDSRPATSGGRRR